MMASPDAAKLVLVSQAALFRPTFPASKMALIGPRALFFHDGPYHARLRRLVAGAFAPESIRRVIPDAESLAVATLESWPSLQERHGSVNTFAEMKKVHTLDCCMPKERHFLLGVTLILVYVLVGLH